MVWLGVFLLSLLSLTPQLTLASKNHGYEKVVKNGTSLQILVFLSICFLVNNEQTDHSRSSYLYIGVVSGFFTPLEQSQAKDSDSSRLSKI